MNDLARRSLDDNSHCCRTGNRQGRFPPHQPMAHAAAAEGARQLDARPPQSARSTIFRTGRLLTPSTPVSSSALAAARRSHRGAYGRGNRGAARRADADVGAVRLVNHGRLTAAVALDAEEPRWKGAQRFGQCLGRRRERIVAIAAPTPARDRSGSHSSRSFSAIWRFISRNSASAASPRRLYSSGVMSGTSPNLP